MDKGDKVQMNDNHKFGLKNAVVVSHPRNGNVHVEHDVWETGIDRTGNPQGRQLKFAKKIRKLIRYTDLYEVDHLVVIDG